MNILFLALDGTGVALVVAAGELFLVRHEIVVVKMSVPEPEDDGLDGEGDGGTAPHPDEVGVLDRAGQTLAERVRKGGGEEEERHDERLHALRRTRVCHLVGGHVGEALGNSTEHYVRELQPHAQRRDFGAG